jgi:hypothetical protein
VGGKECRRPDLDEVRRRCILTKELDKKGAMMKGRKGNTTSSLPLIVVGVFCLIIVIGFVSIMQSCGGSPSSSTPAQNSTNQPAPTHIMLGDNVILDEGTGTTVLLAVTKADFDEAGKSSVAGDTTGLIDMVLNGQAFIVNRGAKALVIDSTWLAFRVRITSTSSDYTNFIGQSGWVDREVCKK